MSGQAAIDAGGACEGRLPANTRLGPVELAVDDLAGALDFYTGALGLELHRHEHGVAAVGAGGEDLLVLCERATGPPPGRHAGLYHVALLYPSREELARALLRLSRAEAAIQGASDHGTHEALYLADPGGNGLELAADRPREQWTSFEEEFARGGPRALDVRGLLDAVESDPHTPRASRGLRVGHIHLHVGDIERALRFYRDVVGFEPTAVLPTAAFLSAGGYHHHIAFNTWRGTDLGPVPPGASGLVRWTVLLSGQRELGQLAERARAVGLEPIAQGRALELPDPWGIRVRVALEDVQPPRDESALAEAPQAPR